MHSYYCFVSYMFDWLMRLNFNLYQRLNRMLTYNFSKEQYVLPEDDRVSETCRSV